MICEVRNYDREVILRNAKFSDVLAIIGIWLNHNKEICYSNPEPIEDYVKIIKTGEEHI